MDSVNFFFIKVVCEKQESTLSVLKVKLSLLMVKFLSDKLNYHY